MPFSASAVNLSQDRLEKVSDVYGLPIEAPERLSPDILDSLVEDAENNRLVSSSEKYVKIVVDENNDLKMEESTYNEYLYDIRTRANDTDTSSGWMKFYTSVFEVNNTTGQASCAFTWLTPPSPRMTDVIGLSLTQGTFDYNTANGFYLHTSPNDNYEHQFTAGEITESGHSVICEVDLRNSDYISGTYDYMFIRANFAKEGTSEGVNGTYGHQKVGLALGLEFSLSRNGILSWSSSLQIATYYTQDKGYVSIRW